MATLLTPAASSGQERGAELTGAICLMVFAEQGSQGVDRDPPRRWSGLGSGHDRDELRVGGAGCCIGRHAGCADDGHAVLIEKVYGECPRAPLGRRIAVGHAVGAQPSEGEDLVAAGLALIGRPDAEEKVELAHWGCARDGDSCIDRRRAK